MTERDRGPRKIDVERILSEDESSGADQVEILDPATGQPASPAPARGDAMAAALAEKEKYYDLWVRSRADFDNFRKRTERERSDERSQAGAALVRSLLPVLDNFDRALAGAPEGDPFHEGVALIRRQLGEALQRGGLEPIEALNAPFDPVYHEAVMTEATDRLPPGHVLEEIQKGYTFHGRVLRPTLVKVSAAAAVPASSAETEGAR